MVNIIVVNYSHVYNLLKLKVKVHSLIVHKNVYFDIIKITEYLFKKLNKFQYFL